MANKLACIFCQNYDIDEPVYEGSLTYCDTCQRMVPVRQLFYFYKINAHESSECGRRGIQHKMKRYNCYVTECINDGCDFRV